MSKTIAKAGLIWGASSALSRVIGLVREAVIGRTLGAGPDADAYWSAFVVPDFLNYLLAGGALSIVFIPIFGAHLARGEEERAEEAFSVVANFLLLATGLLTVALWLAMPLFAPLAAPGFPPEQIAELVALSRIVLPAQIFHVVGGLLSASIQARDRHALPALAPLVYTLGIIGGGLIGGPDAGAYGFAWGALAGSVLGPFGLPLVGALRNGLRWRASFSLSHPDLRKYLVRSLPIMVGFSIVVVDDWYLKREGTLLGTGAAAILSYAKTLMKVPLGVVGLAAGVAVFPTLQRLVAEGRTGEMRAVLFRALRLVILVSFATQVVLTAAGNDVVALVYGRSKLSQEEVASVASCLGLVTIGLAAWAAQSLVARGFYALGNTWMPAVLGTLVAIVSYPLYVWSRQAFGVAGLATVSSVAILLYTLALSYWLARSVSATSAGRGEFAGFAVRAAIALVAGLVAGRAAQIGWTAWGLPESSALMPVHALVLAACGLIAFLGAAWLLGLEEVRTLRARLALPRRRTV